MSCRNTSSVHDTLRRPEYSDVLDGILNNFFQANTADSEQQIGLERLSERLDRFTNEDHGIRCGGRITIDRLKTAQKTTFTFPKATNQEQNQQ